MAVTTAAGCAWTAVSNAAWHHDDGGRERHRKRVRQLHRRREYGRASEPARSRLRARRSRSRRRRRRRRARTRSHRRVSRSARREGRYDGHGDDGGWLRMDREYTSNAPWITVTSGATGSGNGTVTFSVAANTGAQRTGTLTIAGQTFTVTQAAAPPPCRTSIAPPSQSIGAAGGTGTTVASPRRLAAHGPPRVQQPVVDHGDVGRDRQRQRVGRASTSRRTRGAANRHAHDCGPDVHGHAGGGAAPVHVLDRSRRVNPSVRCRQASGTVAVTTAAGCAWTAVSNNSFITVTSGATGSGNGTVGFSVAANTGAARTGTLTIAGQTFTVTQDLRP